MGRFFYAQTSLMKPSDIVAHLRVHCPALAGSVGAGINWDVIEKASRWDGLRAFVVPTDDKASPPQYDNVLVQEITEGMDVVVVWPQKDEPGYEVADEVTAMRRALCLALVGWKPPGSADWLIYEGRSFLHTDRAKLAYAFSFSSLEVMGNTELPTNPAQAETWHEAELMGLHQLEGLDMRLDAIDPMVDKNLKPDGVGPDGRTEHHLKVNLPHDNPEPTPTP